MRVSICLGALACASAFAAVAHADPIVASITADNHYAFFSGSSGGMAYHGGNEVGPGGSPGTYNWSEAEGYSFNSIGPYLYIAAWSDDNIAQGLLANLTINGVDFSTGHAAWEVYATGTNRGDNDPHPTIAEMMGHVFTADAGNLWEAPYIGDVNGGSVPWGPVNGIDNLARWMWVSNPADPDPLSPGSGFGEMLIFRIAVPAPGAAAVLGLGGLAVLRRRRA